jgi:hypothetical protein
MIYDSFLELFDAEGVESMGVLVSRGSNKWVFGEFWYQGNIYSLWTTTSVQRMKQAAALLRQGRDPFEEGTTRKGRKQLYLKGAQPRRGMRFYAYEPDRIWKSRKANLANPTLPF